MCGRYALELALEHPQYLAGVELTEPITNYNVAPTHTVPILVDRALPTETLADPAYTREIHAARWGLLPAWADDPAHASRAFNARSETIFTKPTFREAAISGHCAIPVTGYYEWKTQTTAAGKTAKTPHLIRRADHRPIYLAGLYSWWKIPAHHADTLNSRAGDWLLTCSIITMDSPGNGEYNPGIHTHLGGESPYRHPVEQALGELHNRLPVPLTVADDATISTGDTLTRWLRSGKPTGTSAGGSSLPAYRLDAENTLADLKTAAFIATHTWELYPVGKDVGNVRNNHPALLEPAEDLLSGL